MSVSSKKVSLAVAAAGMTSTIAKAAQNKPVKTLIAGIKDDDPKVRTKAWQSAGQVGAPAVKPLAKIIGTGELEVARAAKRGLWKIVRHVGRPGEQKMKRAVIKKLVELLDDDQSVTVRREVLWMLSEIGNRNSIKPMAALLSNEHLREDARMAIQRIPNKAAMAALRAGFKEAPDDFKPNLAQSLRQRGAMIRRPECVKLIPTKKTNVKPL
jgi:HEAT repeat protein